MSRKDVSDRAVCLAYRETATARASDGLSVYERLMASTGQCEKVCYAAMERAYSRNLIDCGVSLRAGWLTEAGEAMCDDAVE